MNDLTEQHERKEEHNVQQSRVLRRRIAHFIEDGEMEQIILNQKFGVFEFMKLVTFNNIVARILLSGRCPTCDSQHMRDTCIFTYNKTVTSIIVKEKFKKIDTVVAVSTVDDDFENVVAELGGVIIYPYNDDITSDFYHVKKFMLDRHPFVDCMYKMLIVKNRNNNDLETSDDTYNKNFKVSDLYKNYHIVWILDNTTVLFENSLCMLTGKKEIMERKSNMKFDLRVCKKIVNNKTTLMLHAKSYNFFDPSLYKMINFHD